MASEANWVVRGGVVTAEQLANGASPIAEAPGFCQISVAFQPGRGVAELATSSRFPNQQIGVTTLEALIEAGAVGIRETPGRNPVHGDIIVACRPDGTVDPNLLMSLAAVFGQQPNPARGDRRS